jgi:4-amino-4-deoxy-L-arabinose transferase-like glycosyltransferase
LRSVLINPLSVIVFVFVAIGFTWTLWMKPAPTSDYYAYFKLASGLLDHHQFGYPMPTARRLPGYPTLLALPMLISRSYVWLGLFNVLLCAALLPLVHRLTFSLSMGSKWTALLAATLCALNPTFVFFSPVLATEHLFVLLFFSSLVVLFSRRLGSKTTAVFAGLLLGLAVLTRGEAAFYLPVVLFVAWTTSNGRARQKATRTALVIAVSVAAVLPWAVRNWVVIGPGAGMSTVAGENFYFGHNPDLYGDHALSVDGLDSPNEADRQRVWFRRGWTNIADDPSSLLRDIRTGTYELFVSPGGYALWAAMVSSTPGNHRRFIQKREHPWGTKRLLFEFYRVIALLSALGILIVTRIGRVGSFVLYGVLLMNWVCYAVVFWSKPRYRYTAEVVMCILAAFVLWNMWVAVTDQLPRRRRARREMGMNGEGRSQVPETPQ